MKAIAPSVTVPCGHCKGTGRVIHSRMTQLYRLLRGAPGGGLSTQEIARALRIGETNAANIARELHELGLVDRVGGKPFVWSVNAEANPYRWFVAGLHKKRERRGKGA